ncbi:MAG: hypothetical protein GY705_05800 [Bacteroidetes bacterium]|nr:hypothetical protein [Bacteroidota bacterium]
MQLTSEISALMTQSPEERDLEQGVALMAQWFQVLLLSGWHKYFYLTLTNCLPYAETSQ